MAEVIAHHTNSEGEVVTLERVTGGRFDGATCLVVYDDPPLCKAAPMLLDDGVRSWLLKHLEADDRATLRTFVEEALAKAKATTDDDLREIANAPAGLPSSITKLAYAQGLRDGVALCCEQVLGQLDG